MSIDLSFTNIKYSNHIKIIIPKSVTILRQTNVGTHL
jgi:hypothetical protein